MEDCRRGDEELVDPGTGGRVASEGKKTAGNEKGKKQNLKR